MGTYNRGEAGANLKTAGNLFSWVVVLCGIATIGVAIYVSAVSYSPVLYSDSWREIDPIVLHVSPVAPEWLWKQLNEHRVVIPKLFLAADLEWFHARQGFLLASILCIQLLHLILLAWSMHVLGGWSGVLRRTGIGLAAFCLFCPSQWENFVWGFQVCFVLPGLFATLSFVTLLLYWMRSREAVRSAWIYLLISVIASLAATYSLANGNLLWPLLVCAAILLRLRLSAIASFVIAGAASTSLYFYDYVRPPQHASIGTSLQSPGELIRYTAVYFGSVWVRDSARAAELTGMTGLILAIVLVRYLWVRAREIQPFPLQLTLTMLFCVGTAFITSLGRLNFGIAQAFASRYQTIALLFWCCLGLSAVWLAAAGSIRLAAVVVLQVCLLLILARSAWRAPWTIREARLHGFQLNAAGEALLEGIDDREQLYYIGLLRPQYVFAITNLLKQDQLSLYSEGPSQLLDRPLSSIFHTDAGRNCNGAIESVTPVAGGDVSALRVTGWAWDSSRRKPPAYMVFVNGGTIAGLGAVGDWRSSERLGHEEIPSHYVGFTGYVMKPVLAGHSAAYEILGDGTACLVGSVR